MPSEPRGNRRADEDRSSKELIERIELLLVENKFEQAQESFQSLKRKVAEKRENKRMGYAEYIEFKRLEKIIIDEFSRQSELGVGPGE